MIHRARGLALAVRTRAAGLAACLAAVAAACQGSSTALLFPFPEEQVVIAFDRPPTGAPEGAWRLRDALVEGDELVLSLDHAGGCAEHHYWLFAREGFTLLPTAGPVPSASVPLQLLHDDGGDRCEALLTRTLRWSLVPLRDEYVRRFGPGPVTLVLRIGEGHPATGEVTLVWGP